MMPTIRVRRKILRWGNAYGIRLTKADLERLGAHEKQEASVDLSLERGPTDLSHLHLFKDDPDAGTRHDDILGDPLDDH